MNKNILVACVTGVLVSASAFAQGSLAFKTSDTPKTPILDHTKGDAKIAGANYLVDLLVNGSAAGIDKVLSAGNVAFAPVSPLSGGSAGLFLGGTLVVGSVKPGVGASITVRAWDKTTGATYDLATVRGSQTFNVAALGGDKGDGSAPLFPASLYQVNANGVQIGYTGFSLDLVPEPSTYALAALGLGGLLLFRRK